MASERKTMTYHPPEFKVQICEAIEAAGGGYAGVKKIAAKNNLVNPLVNTWWLEYQVYGPDTWADRKKEKAERIKKSINSAPSKKELSKSIQIMSDDIADLRQRIASLEAQSSHTTIYKRSSSGNAVMTNGREI